MDTSANFLNLKPSNLLPTLWKELFYADITWQILAIAVSIFLAFIISKAWRNKVKNDGKDDTRLDLLLIRLAFPLSAVAFCGIFLILLKEFGFHYSFLDLAIPLLGSMALVRTTIFILRQTFHKNQLLQSWEKFISTAIWCWMALYIADIVPYLAIGLDKFGVSIGETRVSLWVLLNAIVLIFFTIIIALWISSVIERRLMKLESLDSSLKIIGIRLIKTAFTLLALMISLSTVGIDMTALSVFTGALGVGLGFGLQKIASNYVSGFIILLERSIKLGNVIEVAGNSGQVSQITTRFTVIKTLTGIEHIIPNEMLISNVVKSHTLNSPLMRDATSIGVAYGTDLDLAMKLMVQAAEKQPRVLKDPAPGVLLTSFGDSAINLSVGFWVNDPENGTVGLISDINKEIWKLFCENNISVPFPQREVRILNK